MEVAVSNGKSTFIIVRPESDDYPGLFKLSEETARVIDGTPIMDLHLTVQAIRNVHDFSLLRERLEEYSSKVDPFEIKVKNIVRMNVNNQQGRLWMLAEKTKQLEMLYNGLGRIARELGYDSYPYKFENWLPHIKIVELPENKSTQIKDPTFGANRSANHARAFRKYRFAGQSGNQVERRAKRGQGALLVQHSFTAFLNEGADHQFVPVLRYVGVAPCRRCDRLRAPQL